MAKECVFDLNAYGIPPARKKQTPTAVTQAQLNSAAASTSKETQNHTHEILELPLSSQKESTPTSKVYVCSEPYALQKQYRANSNNTTSSPSTQNDAVSLPQSVQEVTASVYSNGLHQTSTAQIQNNCDKTSIDHPLDVGQIERQKQKLPPTHSQSAEAASGISLTLSPHKMPITKASNSAMDIGDQLRQLQNDSLQKISRKLVADRKRGRDKYNTTSLRDLDLARAPVDSARPADSRRAWAEDSPSTTYMPDEDTVQLSEERNPDSMVPQADTLLTSQPPTISTNLPHNIALEGSKWADKKDMKGDNDDLNSNAWGSAAPSDATHDTNVSDEYFGKLLNRNAEDAYNRSLADWEGKMIAPPADWNERPRYNNNNSEFKLDFKKWVHGMSTETLIRSYQNTDVPRTMIAPEILMDLSNHADGISMSLRTTTINMDNAAEFGYTRDLAGLTQYAKPVTDYDFNGNGKGSFRNADDIEFKNETTESLVSNWLKHLQNARLLSMVTGAPIKDEESSTMANNKGSRSSEEKYIPLLNIYLRPATRADLSELTRIYNWYVTEGAGPAETAEIGESDMEDRMRLCRDSYFPFIVAAKKNQNGAQEMPLNNDEEFSRRRNLPVKHKQRVTLTRVEQLAGFCCLQDLTAPDYVEHISAELEIYVDPGCKKQGVGTCLMDKMLEICDSGHRKTTACNFHCDQRFRHSYGPGGSRDIHKIFILLRKWHHAKPAAISVQHGRRHRKLPYAKKSETDYEVWLKSWLESWGFEEEGFLRKIGARHGRYLDMIYLGRETAWQPAEGNLPGPDPRHQVSAQDLQNDADEEDDAQ